MGIRKGASGRRKRAVFVYHETPSLSQTMMNNIDDLVFRKAVIYIIVFVFVLGWNWVFWKSLGTVRNELVGGVSDLSRSMMESFDFHNTSWISAEDQDRRWDEYKHYFSKYQHRLRQTHFEYYVVYTTTNSGLANKLNGLVSSLLIAMVTNRGLLLDDWASFDSYFDLHLDGHHYDYNSSFAKGSPLKIWRRCIEAKRLKKGYINRQFGEKNINVITNCPLFASLAKNDLYYDAFVSRGLVRTAQRGDYPAIAEDIYYRLLNFFSLSPYLQSRMENITELWEDRYVIGMQIRVGLGNSAFLDNCKFLFMDDVDTFIHYAEYFTNRTSLTPLWFISTDSPAVESLFTERYGNITFYLSDMPMMHTKVLAYNFNEPAVNRAILDNYLLSQSDLLITTAWSSFGEMAVGRMSKGNTIMITRGDSVIEPPPVVSFNREE